MAIVVSLGLTTQDDTVIYDTISNPIVVVMPIRGDMTIIEVGMENIVVEVGVVSQPV